MPDKDEIAERLAAAHREAEPGIVWIVRLVSAQEAEAREPVKLLETAAAPERLPPRRDPLPSRLMPTRAEAFA